MRRALLALVLTGCADPVLPLQVEGEAPDGWLEDQVGFAEAVLELEVELVDADGPAVIALVPGLFDDTKDCGLSIQGSKPGGTALCRRVAMVDPACPDEGILAHELGHLLQLEHVDDEGNLMVHDDPGPELDDDQIQRAHRAARYLDRCYQE